MDEDFVAHLRSLPPIPKHIHLIWPVSNVLTVDADDQMIKNGPGKLAILNPDWQVHVWNDTQIIDYIANSNILTRLDKELLKIAHVIERTDAFRLLILYEMGGFYQVRSRALLSMQSWTCLCQAQSGLYAH